MKLLLSLFVGLLLVACVAHPAKDDPAHPTVVNEFGASQ